MRLIAAAAVVGSVGAQSVSDATDFGGTWSGGSYSSNPPSLGFSSAEFWVGQTAVSLDGVDAVEGRVRYYDAERSWTSTAVTGPTTLYFSYRGSSTGGEGGSFSVNGLSLLAFPAYTSYETRWKEATVQIPEGGTTVTWQLYGSRGRTGKVYIDQVWTSNDPRPRVTDASDRRGTFGLPFRWEVPVNSTTPATLEATDLPSGLRLDHNTHVISGTPTGAGSFEATLTAVNASGRHITKVPFEIEPGSTSISEGVDAPNSIFIQSEPPTTWGGVTGIGHAGNDSARGHAIDGLSAGNVATLSTTFTGPGALTFWYRCDSIPGPLQAWTHHALLKLYVGIPATSPQPTMYLESNNWTKVTVQIPAGEQTVSWRPTRTDSGLPSSALPLFAYLDQVAVVTPGSPQISVQRAFSNTPIAGGDIQSFDNVFTGGISSRTFNVTNTGLADLTGLVLTIDGADAADFSLVSAPASSVTGPNGSTAFTVQFSPRSPGAKTATLHIASNDPDDNPFHINLTGTGLEPVNRIVEQGAPVTLSLTAPPAGSSVQWLKDGVEMSGATGSTLTLPSVQPWQIGVYSVRVTTAGTSNINDVAVLGLAGVPAEIWRGLVACYPFNGSAEDLCRPGKPASLVNTTELVADAQRGGIAHVRGKGFIVPPLEGEPEETRGPGGYMQISRPALVEGEPFTVSFLIKEEGFSYWHGESLLTMGEGATSIELLSHYYVGSFGESDEHYGGPVGPVEFRVSDHVMNGSAVTLDLPWTAYTVVGDGNTLRLYRDGQLMGTTTYGKPTVGDFFIGRHWWVDGTYSSTRLIAKVDDLRIYNRALTTPEVQRLFSAVQTTPTAGSFESWVLVNGLSGAEAAVTGDRDHDGLTNWEEFSFGTSPANGREPLMKAVVVGPTLTLTWFERDGLIYSLKETSDLRNPWTQSLSLPEFSPDQTNVPIGYKRMQVSILVPQPGTPDQPRFFRVEATKAP